MDYNKNLTPPPAPACFGEVALLVGGQLLLTQHVNLIYKTYTNLTSGPASTTVSNRSILNRTLNIRYKRQAIRDVGKFTEVLRDRPSHYDGGKRQGPICRKILRDTVSGGEQKFELVIAISCSFSSPFFMV